MLKTNLRFYPRSNIFNNSFYHLLMHMIFLFILLNICINSLIHIQLFFYAKKCINNICCIFFFIYIFLSDLHHNTGQLSSVDLCHIELYLQ